MRNKIRSLESRVLLHCSQLGIKPPRAAVRRFALLRCMESEWWQAGKLDTERQELLEDLAFRMRLHEPASNTPLCVPDLPDCIHAIADHPSYARWPDAPLCISMRDLQ